MLKRLALLLAVLVGTGLLTAAPAFAAAPTITSFTPTSGKLNTPVVITGTNFAAPATVTFGGVAAATVTVSSATKITAYVPYTGTTGKITVTTPGGTATSSATFTVTPGLLVSAAGIGSPGSTRTVYYAGFGAYEALDVYFDTAAVGLASASGQAAGNTALTVPATATPGTHWITAIGRHSGYSAQIPFTVRSNWPQFGYVANHRGSNPVENVLDPSAVPDLDVSWRSPSYARSFTSPAVVSGVVYAAFSNGSVHAYTEATGAPLWSYTTGESIDASPAVYGGVVYIGSQDDYLYALDATTGALRWRFNTGAAVNTSPTVGNGVVYVGADNDITFALSATTGAEKWSYPTADTSTSPALANGLLFLATADGAVDALDAISGDLVWTRSVDAGVTGSVVVIGGFVYVGTTAGTVYALETPDGAAQWARTLDSEIEGTVAVSGGVVYVGTEDGTAYALAGGDGSVRWTTTAPGGSLTGAVSVADGVVYIADIGQTYLLAANSGNLLTVLPGGTTVGGVAVVNAAVFVPSYFHGTVTRYALPAAGGAARPDPARLGRPRGRVAR